MTDHQSNDDDRGPTPMAFHPTAPMRLRLLRIAAGDDAFDRRLRAMLWEAYAEAGYPSGPSEADMFRWAQARFGAAGSARSSI